MGELLSSILRLSLHKELQTLGAPGNRNTHVVHWFTNNKSATNDSMTNNSISKEIIIHK